ncbi:MAG: leucine-rich repeat domain-containing protein, partial [Lachnospiraceae bacterium]|nr:leucine-rich repeat domain-containing protein [Lachnospiraceae bacterium]
SASMNKIADYAFSDCENLRSVYISASVNEIGEYAFSGAGKFEIFLPKSLKKIGVGALEHDEEVIYNVYYEGSEEEWNAIEGVGECGLTENDIIMYNQGSKDIEDDESKNTDDKKEDTDDKKEDTDKESGSNNDDDGLKDSQSGNVMVKKELYRNGSRYVSIVYNLNPAVTGKKIKETDIIRSMTFGCKVMKTKTLVDDEKINLLAKGRVKFKVTGGKNAGDAVTVTIKKIKIKQKDSNINEADLKEIVNELNTELAGKTLDGIVIRPINLSNCTVKAEKSYIKEGRVVVKWNKDHSDIKSAYAIVPKNGEYATGNKSGKAKKLKLKKGSYNYDSSKKVLTFDGTVVKGAWDSSNRKVIKN